jgi:hypothetical protein
MMPAAAMEIVHVLPLCGNYLPGIPISLMPGRQAM